MAGNEQVTSRDAADLRASREAAGLTREQLGKVVWRSGRTVEKWEQGLAPVPRWAWKVMASMGVARKRAKAPKRAPACSPACADE